MPEGPDHPPVLHLLIILWSSNLVMWILLPDLIPEGKPWVEDVTRNIVYIGIGMGIASIGLVYIHWKYELNR